MIFEVFSIYDAKAEAYLPPFILPNIALAKRVFGECVNSSDHQFSKSPFDYTLFRLGQFDDSAGQYLLERGNQSLGNVVEYIRQDDPTATEGHTNGEDKSEQPQQSHPSVQPSSPGQNPAE